MTIITAVNFEIKFTAALILSSHHVNASLQDTGILEASQPKGLTTGLFCTINELYTGDNAAINMARTEKKSKGKYVRKERQTRFCGDLNTKQQDVPNYALKLSCLNNSPVTGRLLEGDSH